jgi:ankyrin repeat protein
MFYQNLNNVFITSYTILIKHNVDINQRGGLFDKIPIYYACRYGHTDIVQILLGKNCDIHMFYQNLNNVFMTSFTGSIYSTMNVTIIVKQNLYNICGLVGKAPIYYACHNGRTDIVQILLDNNYDIHGAMHGACIGGYKDIVEILIKHNVENKPPR